jgi:hypothetical protein
MMTSDDASRLHPHQVLIETQLQNAMPRHLFLHSVEFKPAPQFEVESLNVFPPNAFPPSLAAQPLTRAQPEAAPGTAPGAGGSGSGAASVVASAVGLPAFGHLAYLKSGDTQQYMFRLRGKVPPAQLRQINTLGGFVAELAADRVSHGHRWPLCSPLIVLELDVGRMEVVWKLTLTRA